MVSRHTILYAEDDEDDLFLVKKCFERHDHIHIEHAINGLEALTKLEKMIASGYKPCLAILDINMPGLDGRETLIRIRSHEEMKEIPVILFTTSSSHHDKKFAEQWGVEMFTKPLHFNDLEHIAREFVDRCNFEINKIGSK